MDGSSIESAIVSIHHDEIIKDYFTNSLGKVEIENLPIGEYDVFVGKWDKTRLFMKSMLRLILHFTDWALFL